MRGTITHRIIIITYIFFSVLTSHAEADYSAERSAGLGVSFPNTLNVRLWISENIGVETTARVSFNAAKSDLETTTGVLFKLLNGRTIDVYGTAGLQLFSTEANEFTALRVAPVGGLGLEASPSDRLALSIEARAQMLMSLTALSGGLNAALHVYF